MNFNEESNHNILNMYGQNALLRDLVNVLKEEKGKRGEEEEGKEKEEEGGGEEREKKKKKFFEDFKELLVVLSNPSSLAFHVAGNIKGYLFLSSLSSISSLSFSLFLFLFSLFLILFSKRFRRSFWSLERTLLPISLSLLSFFSFSSLSFQKISRVANRQL